MFPPVFGWWIVVRPMLRNHRRLWKKEIVLNVSAVAQWPAQAMGAMFKGGDNPKPNRIYRKNQANGGQYTLRYHRNFWEPFFFFGPKNPDKSQVASFLLCRGSNPPGSTVQWFLGCFFSWFGDCWWFQSFFLIFPSWHGLIFFAMHLTVKTRHLGLRRIFYGEVNLGSWFPLFAFLVFKIFVLM